MIDSLSKKICESRLVLQNPYAYIDGDGCLSAIPKKHIIQPIESKPTLEGVLLATPEQIRESRRILQDPYAHVSGEGTMSGTIEHVASTSGRPLRKTTGAGLDVRGLLNNPYAFIEDDESMGTACTVEVNTDIFVLNAADLVGRKVGQRFSNDEIESIARALHRQIWVNRHLIWKNGIPTDPTEMLVPSVVVEALGYRFELSDTLGRIHSDQGDTIEVGGYIDRDRKYAGVSRQLPFEMRNFTAAHEMAHAVLHGGRGLHRDRGIDGSAIDGTRKGIEYEADKLATFFLMPEKLVKTVFRELFCTENFTISHESAFALITDNPQVLRARCKTLRDLSRVLAAAERFGGRFFPSLSRRFHVSTEAMAIRLEELKLLSL